MTLNQCKTLITGVLKGWFLNKKTLDGFSEVNNELYFRNVKVNGAGANGADGKDGKDGVDGKDGRDGIDGKDGKDGVNGLNGADGFSPSVTKEEIENGYRLNIVNKDNTDSLEIHNGTNGSSGGTLEQEQADWEEEDNTKPSYIKNKPEIPTIPTVPTKISQLANDSNFITETDVNTKIANAANYNRRIIVNEEPSQPIAGKESWIYLVENPNKRQKNKYIEYFFINNGTDDNPGWVVEEYGKANIEIDLSDYIKLEDLEEGDNITITTDPSTGKTTISSTGSGGGGISNVISSAGLIIDKTLLASGWDSNNQQTLVFTDYDPDLGGVIGIPTTASASVKDAAAEAVINVVSQSGASFTFSCENIPEVDIPVTLYAGGGGSSSAEFPEGGEAGQALVKKSNENNDVEWKDIFNLDGNTFDKLKNRPEKPTNQEVANIISPKPQGIVADTAWTVYSPNERQVGIWQEYRTVEGQQVLMQKPVYEKTVNTTTSTTTGNDKEVSIGDGISVDKYIEIKGVFEQTVSSDKYTYPYFMTDNSLTGYVKIYARNNSVVIRVTQQAWLNTPISITVRYTKTTDEWIAVE